MRAIRIIIVLFIFIPFYSGAQKIIFTENFQDEKMNEYWQIVTGNWKICSVDDMRIAPAEGGYQYVLCSGSRGDAGEQIVRLFVDLPDSIKKYKKITLSFYYYFIANVAKANVETEFYQKEMKDGSRGKLWSASLPYVKGRWSRIKRTFTIPKNSNQFRIVFSGISSSLQQDGIVCFDNIVIAAL